MTEQKPISEAALVEARRLYRVRLGRENEECTTYASITAWEEALARTLEAFSDAVGMYFGVEVPSEFAPFILPDPVDPLEELVRDMGFTVTDAAAIAERLREALAQRGLEIREITP